MDDRGAASTIGFAIAIGLFMAALGGMLLATSDIGQDAVPSRTASNTLSAESLADVLMSPGIDWGAGPDGIARLGLLNANGSGLDPAHLQFLRGASYEAAANGLVDYDEARASLGMANQDFHLRIYPPSLQVHLQSLDLSHIRAAYIGHWLDIPSVSTLPLSEQLVADAARDTIGAAAGLISGDERSSLDSLGMSFDNLINLNYAEWAMTVDLPILPDIPLVNYVASSLLAGDVYPDDKQYLNTAMVSQLNNYDILFIGSQVDQSALTSDAFKSAVKDWVLAGGSLVVFGSDSQNFQWIEPLFSVGVATVNGGATAPDVSHPLLQEPYELSWSDYDSHGLGWDIKETGSGAHYNDFQHIIVDDGEDVLAVSNDGAFGDGRIYLTTYRPGEIAQNLGVTEANAFVTNIVLFDDRSDLYLDYGATVSDDQAVSSAVRLTHIWDGELGLVPMRVEVLYW